MPRKPWSTLRDPIMADPVRRRRIEEMSRASRVVLALGKLCDQASDASSDEPAPEGVPASEALRINVEDSDYLTTLKDGIERLGGYLEVTAVFPNERIYLLDESQVLRCDDTTDDEET